MIVFVTGATGALGVPTVSLLTGAGHQVRGLARNAASAAKVRELGAEPVSASLLDPAALAAAVRGADAILHLATRIVPFGQARRRAAWRENDAIRRVGTSLLIKAALASDVGTVIYPSFAPIYADGGRRWLEFGDPIAPTDILASTVAAEHMVDWFTAKGGRGIVLRIAGVYGAHSAATQQVMTLADNGISGFAGSADAFWPMVWDEDAAAALVAALHTDGLAGGYDVADDEPLTRADLAAALAAAVGRQAVRRPPAWLVRAGLGARMSFLLRSQRVSNRRFKAVTGWQPQVPDATVGLGRIRKALVS